MTQENLLDEMPEIPRTWHQLAILVLDGSPSMLDPSAQLGNISKAAAVNVAVRELLTRLAASKAKKNFSIAIIAFSDSVETRLKPTPVVMVDDNASYNPIIDGGRGTHIGSALSAANMVATNFFNEHRGDGVPCSVVVVLMSDGANTGGSDPAGEAESLKRQPDMTLCTTLFAGRGEDDGEARNLLMQIATSPDRHYKTTYDVATLRDFFFASASFIQRSRSDG